MSKSICGPCDTEPLPVPFEVIPNSSGFGSKIVHQPVQQSLVYQQ